MVLAITKSGLLGWLLAAKGKGAKNLMTGRTRASDDWERARATAVKSSEVVDWLWLAKGERAWGAVARRLSVNGAETDHWSRLK